MKFFCTCKMVSKYICIALIALVLGQVVVHCDPIQRTSVLKLKNGQVRGIVEEVESGWWPFGGQKVNFYQGIRYGHANRFEIAKPTEPWSDVYDATTPRDICFQFGGLRSELGNPNTNNSFSDDCLYLNVFQPDQGSQTTNRSVMVWIHGGSFEIGTIFSPGMNGKHIAHDGDVIVVTISYRLGVLGFLYGGSVPGNLGLHDQILALKWVQENIHYFGGDPAQVTIFGESAGSDAVALLVLSPLAKGLFHRAIMQSGGPLTSIVSQSKNNLLEKTKHFANKLHCPVDPIEHTIDCVRNKTIAQLQSASLNDFIKNEFFVPLYGDELMPLRPDEALKKGKFNQVDLMFGVTRNEGSGFAQMVLNQLTNTTAQTLEEVKQGIVKMMTFYGVPNGKEVADFYTAKLVINSTQDELRIAESNVWGDFALVCPTILFGEEYAKSSPTNKFYSYRLMQEVAIQGLPKWYGVTHAQDVFYLFSGKETELGPNFHQLSADMIRAWTSFAKTGNPGKMDSLQWETAFSSQSLIELQPITRYMHLKASKYKMVDNFYKPTCNSFWKPKLFD